MVGQIISHYKILEKLGEGGMGVVYRAEDTKLKRTVTLKFLAPELTRDKKAKARFIQEAQAAAALNHTNICTIFEIDDAKDPAGTDMRSFIAMEYIEGQSLKEKIESAPLGVDATIQIIAQVADGLRKAHERGIVHRDIKSANIMVTDEGQAKIMDFGIAKLAGQKGITKRGTTLGTVAYMSPEQAQGLDLDHRTDIWSLGVVMYEMLTGQLPFRGDIDQVILYNIMNNDPAPIEKYHSDLSSEILRVLDRSLMKEPENRYQLIEEMLVDLGAEDSLPASKRPAFRKSKLRKTRRKRIVLTAALALFISIVVLLTIFVLKPFMPESPSWLQPGVQPQRLTSEIGDERGRISPDGHYLVYQKDSRTIKLKNIKTAETKTLLDVEQGTILGLSWSPDGTHIAVSVFTKDEPSSSILIVSILGNITHRWNTPGCLILPTWSPDGNRLAFSLEARAGLPLVITNIDGSNKQEFLTESLTLHTAWSPDAKKIAFVEILRKGPRAVIRILDVETGAVSDSLKCPNLYVSAWWKSGLAWSPDGRYLVYVGHDGARRELYALPMSLKSYSVVGQPIRITDRIGGGELFWPSFSSDGQKLCFGIDEANYNIYVMPIDVPTAKIVGKPTAIAIDRQVDRDPYWMSDGKGVVFLSRRDGQFDVYSYSFASKQTKRLTFSKTIERRPQCSPDGVLVSFYADKAIWAVPSIGGSQRRLTPNLLDDHSRYVWFVDGRCLFVTVPDSSNPSYHKLMKMEIANGSCRQISTNLRLNPITHDVCFSPNGRLLAISGVSISSDEVIHEGLSVLDLKTLKMKHLLTQEMTMPRGRISWTKDGRYILRDHWTPEEKRYYELVPADGSRPKRISMPKINVRGDIFVSYIDPSGKNVLITVRSPEADMWVLGAE